MPQALTIAAPDGTIDAHLFTPAAGAYPPVILFTDIGGIRPAYMEKALHIADAGYAVLMPNIYYRTMPAPVVPEGRHFHDVISTLRGYAELLTPDALARDFAALVAAIETEPSCARGPVGAVGYCLTGGFPVRLASLHPDRVGAAAGFHSAALAAAGNPRAILDVVEGVKARVYFGHADRDEWMPPEEIAAVDGALARAGVHFTTELYAGAMHGFSNSDTAAYDAEADALHFKRLFTLLGETIAVR